LGGGVGGGVIFFFGVFLLLWCWLGCSGFVGVYRGGGGGSPWVVWNVSGWNSCWGGWGCWGYCSLFWVLTGVVVGGGGERICGVFVGWVWWVVVPWGGACVLGVVFCCRVVIFSFYRFVSVWGVGEEGWVVTVLGFFLEECGVRVCGGGWGGGCGGLSYRSFYFS